MSRSGRTLGVLAVCALAVLAGCGGLSGDGGSAETTTLDTTTGDTTPADDATTGQGTTATDSTTGSDDAATTDAATTEPGGEGTGDVAAYTPAGETLNATRLGRDHFRAYDRADSMTLENDLFLGNETATGAEFNVTHRYDWADDRALEDRETYWDAVTHVIERQRATFTAGDTTWRRTAETVNGSTNVAYAVESEPYDDLDPVAVDESTASQAGWGLAWESQGVETHDGATVTRYEATGVANHSAVPTFGDVDTREIARNFRGTLHVTSDGRIAKMVVAYEFESNRGDFLVTYRQSFSTGLVNETTVAEPDWLSEAESETGGE